MATLTFFILFTHAHNLLFLFLDIRNSPEDEREALKETTQKRLERGSF